MVNIPACFQRSEAAQRAYGVLMEHVASLPDVRVEPKAQSVHCVAGKAAFLGVHPRANGVRLTVVLARPLSNDRVVKAEQVSKQRFHNEVDVTDGLDEELKNLIAEAHGLQTS